MTPNEIVKICDKCGFALDTAVCDARPPDCPLRRERAQAIEAEERAKREAYRNTLIAETD